MTCIHCKADTPVGEPYVTYGGVVFCNWDCLAEWYVETDTKTTPEVVEERAEFRNND